MVMRRRMMMRKSAVTDLPRPANPPHLDSLVVHSGNATVSQHKPHLDDVVNGKAVLCGSPKSIGATAQKVSTHPDGEALPVNHGVLLRWDQRQHPAPRAAWSQDCCNACSALLRLDQLDLVQAPQVQVNSTILRFSRFMNRSILWNLEAGAGVTMPSAPHTQLELVPDGELNNP